MTPKPPVGYRPCQAPGPMYGHCGNGATYAVVRQDGTGDTGYLCRGHAGEAMLWPRGAELAFNRLAPEVAP